MVYLRAADPCLAVGRMKKIVVALAHPAVSGIKKEKLVRSIILALRIAPLNAPMVATILRIEDDACAASRPAAHPAGLRGDEVHRVQADVLGIVHRFPDGFILWLSLTGRTGLPTSMRRGLALRPRSLRRQRE